MKRSEMVQNIAIELMSRLPEWEKQERLNFASEILQCIEIEGMLPPKWYDKFGPYEMYRHTWEPEDE